nr:hypothetical protein HmN_000059400 [Hymenolepis microstoma]
MRKGEKAGAKIPHTLSLIELMGEKVSGIILPNRQLLKEKKNKTIGLQWILGHCDIIGNERADTLDKKETTILQVMDGPISFYTMKTLIRREFKALISNELKARRKEKQWTAALSNIADWPRLEAVAEFRLRTGHDCLAKRLHRIEVYAQPTCPHVTFRRKWRRPI